MEIEVVEERRASRGSSNKVQPAGRSIGIVSLSAIADDPRVRRQGDLFDRRGWQIAAFGLAGALSPAPSWPCTGRRQAPFDGQAGALDRALRKLRRARDIALVYLRPRQATAAYWYLNESYEGLLQSARSFRADIWLANDWTALPIVEALAAEQGVPYAYDTHELAVDEYAERWLWRLAHRPIIAEIERTGILGAAVTSCVSHGIADRLSQLYRLELPPRLVRNMPGYEPHQHRSCGERVEVLYHGIVARGRGLETCIDSVPLWRKEFHLTIRGPASAEYRDDLGRRIEARGLGDRVTLAPPVPMIDLVKEAARFDVGLFALPGHSQQNVHVLPNKFFEYTMAGLALCVSDLPEMTALLREHDLGRSIPVVTPEAIAAAINGFDRASIDACKARSLEAAKTLNWEKEADRFFDAIDRAVRDRAGQGLAAQ